ncbi:major facilitator superfamily domain-containing protein [Trichoderma barbatum]
MEAKTQPSPVTAPESCDSSTPDEKSRAQEKSIESKKSSKENTTALLQVVGAFFLMFNSWGMANTYGAFQTYYEGALLKDRTPSDISWIGSMQAFLLLFIGGVVTGPIYDAGHLRGLVIVGSICSVFGLMMTSICKKYWELILAQGLVMGLGAGCLLLPSIAVMPQYYTSRRALATGIGAAGSGVGGIIYPIIFRQLQPRIGFEWTTRAMAFIMLATLMIPITVMRAKSFPSMPRPWVDPKVLRNIPFVLFTVAEFFGFMGMYIPFYYISSYGAGKNIVDLNVAFYLLAIMNASSVFGRIVPNFFADTVGPLNISMPFCLVCAVIAFCWTSVSSVGGVIVFCISYGFFAGTFVSMAGPALASLSTDMSLVGTHIGMSFSFGALGLLVGNPVAGVLLDDASWIGPCSFCGTANILAALFIFAARTNKVGLRILVKV